MIQIFPHSLVRIAGGNFSSISHLSDKSLNELYFNYSEAINQYEGSKFKFCDDLLSWIRKQDNQKTQNVLQNFRRDIFNNRTYKERWNVEVLPLLSSTLLNDFNNLVIKTKAYVLNKEIANKAYSQALNNSRIFLQQQCQDSELLKGLSLAAPDLMNNIQHFITQDPDLFKKRENNLEASVLKYVSRYRCKTSPFSTFTNLAINSNDFLPSNLSKTGNIETKCHVKLNNYLLYYLQNVLFQYNSFTQYLPLRLNPTLREFGMNYTFLLNHNNIESFQTLPITPVLQLIKATINGDCSNSSQSEICKQLLEYVDSGKDEMKNYLNKLIQVGFLEYDINISGNDPNWDVSLTKLLEPLSVELPILDSIIIMLKSLQKMALQFGNQKAKDRLITLQDAYHIFTVAYNNLHELVGLPSIERKAREERISSKINAQLDVVRPDSNKKQEDEYSKASMKFSQLQKNKEEVTSKYDFNQSYVKRLYTNFTFQPKQLLYEDSVKQLSFSQVVSDSDINNFTVKIDYLLGVLPIVDFRLEEKTRMYRFFIDKFGLNAQIDILTFYEQYYKIVKLPIEAYNEKMKQTNKDNEQTSVKIPEYYNLSVSESKQIIDLKKWMGLVNDKLYKKYSSNDSVIHISKDFFDDIDKPDLTMKSEGPPSYGSFVQFCRENGQTKGVVNGVFLGLGKMMGRFLYLFPSEVTHDLVYWNKTKASSSGIVAENTDGTFFNANLHPPLLPYEIQSPGGQSSLPIDQQIPVNEFIVEPDSVRETLLLKHAPTGKTVNVHDLCFQVINGRSKLYQLLEILNDTIHPTFNPILRAINTFTDKQRQVSDPGVSPYMYSRVIFDDTVIIQRQHWYFPLDLLPKRLNQESDFDYYLRVRAWSNHHKLPNRVFVLCEEVKSLKYQPGNTRHNADDGKPQFIDFHSPSLVNLFSKIINRVSLQLKIVEMLPVEEHLLPAEDGPHVTEHLIQWYH